MELDLQFEWDDQKAAFNQKRHKVSFELATLIFLDNNRITAIDKRNDYGETRYVTVGLIENRVHVVVYTKRQEVIRLISSRKANSREQKRYYGNR
ncbi:MAG: BrnT family toxin [Gloeocapsa sp. DLM2.Bin57]|nr:MAG: BrnT family toxin [Gloeocapsa sp. DLM2.Bin57]